MPTPDPSASLNAWQQYTVQLREYNNAQYVESLARMDDLAKLAILTLFIGLALLVLFAAARTVISAYRR